jgi:acyl-CoA reductase-like NAD-dependent aldehyde dehydrogenase
VVISPKTMICGGGTSEKKVEGERETRKGRTRPVLAAVSQATFDQGSAARQASRMASETWSQILSVERERRSRGFRGGEERREEEW